nr:MAG TPA: hypothetical protein [Caudoviricetes sp.]
MIDSLCMTFFNLSAYLRLPIPPFLQVVARRFRLH